jgi:peptide/nickel transport system ATP-binding protein
VVFLIGFVADSSARSAVCLAWFRGAQRLESAAARAALQSRQVSVFTPRTWPDVRVDVNQCSTDRIALEDSDECRAIVTDNVGSGHAWHGQEFPLVVLEVRDLHVSFPTERGPVQAVRGVSIASHHGRTLAIVGESGSGKSTCASSILRLHANAQVSGQVLFHGEDLLTAEPRRLRQIRGARISMILQDPLAGLHPYYKVGWQIVETIRSHRPHLSRGSARDIAISLLDRVGLPDPRRTSASYPFQLSGGMRQRSMIAMAIALDPEVLIADEPTTAVDATVQAEILDLLHQLQEENNMALILVTHDLSVVSKIADDIVVMYGGSVMEWASRDSLFANPAHPYTGGLLRSSRIDRPGSAPLYSIPGNPPDSVHPPRGCPFHPRCHRAIERCHVDAPPLIQLPEARGHECACWLAPDHGRAIGNAGDQ